MKKLGIVGGIGPSSTVDYYLGIIDGRRAKAGGERYPEIIIYSIDMFQMLSYIEAGQWDRAAEQLSGAVNALADAGAELAVIASNTPHLVFDEIQRLSRLPLISIVEETCKYIEEKRYRRVLTIGTLFTMQNGLYSKPLQALGVAALLPTEREQREIYALFFPNLENGIVIPEDKANMLALVDRIVREQDTDAALLGCTELPMMIRPGELSVPVIDTTRVHIESIVRAMKS